MIKSRSRRPSAALATSACRAEMLRVRNVTACARVVSSSRVLPVLRGGAVAEAYTGERLPGAAPQL